jgi:hypothetical protein
MSSIIEDLGALGITPLATGITTYGLRELAGAALGLRAGRPWLTSALAGAFVDAAAAAF